MWEKMRERTYDQDQAAQYGVERHAEEHAVDVCRRPWPRVRVMAAAAAPTESSRALNCDDPEVRTRWICVRRMTAKSSAGTSRALNSSASRPR